MVEYDCAIVGGGMIGAACALSLAQQGLSVVLIEKYAPVPFNESQPYDLRVSAVSLASQHLLKQLGVWPSISKRRLCEYKRLGVWELETCYTEFNAETLKETHLGHIIENRLIQLALWEGITQQENVSLLCPEELISFTQSDTQVELKLSSKSLCCKMLIGADGANSQVRRLAHIGTTGWDYQNSAMLINVSSDITPQDITWQKYLPTGPVAFLPLQNISDEQVSYASLVWYHHKDEIKRLSTLSNEQLTTEVLQNFPDQIGEIKVLDKGAFNLTRRHANTYVKNRVLLLGDAAHTINPMAGQGVNLGFKDVKALEKVICTAIGSGECWDSPNVFKRYETLRRTDNLMMMSSMDVLSSGFSHPSPLIKGLRNAAFMAINKLPVLKSKALAYACGI